MLRIILLVLLVAILKTPGAWGQEDLERGGTLPLRLRGGGTLPLKLHGQATSPTNNTVATQLRITSAMTDPLPANANARFACQTSGDSVTAHAAQGSALVGTVQFTIDGICYDHATRRMEVVATRLSGGLGNEHSYFVGSLPAPEPESFAGRLMITGSTPPAGAYSFSTVATAESLNPAQ